jgi:5'-nucleotidase / UDP-sugar diphosphatase
MKIWMPIVGIAMLMAMGCQNKPDSTSANNSVTDVAAAPAPASTYTPAPAPEVVQPAPVMATALPTAGDDTSATPAMATDGSKYTVKRGDTLWKIAATHYNDGKQWHKIVDANPGLSPTSLKVGQTITLP